MVCAWVDGRQDAAGFERSSVGCRKTATQARIVGDTPNSLLLATCGSTGWISLAPNFFSNLDNERELCKLLVFGQQIAQ